MENILTIADMKDLGRQLIDGDISYSRMVEIINEKAFIQLCNGIEKQVLKNKELQLENEKLKQVLHGIYNLCDNDNPTHEYIWHLTNVLLNPVK